MRALIFDLDGTLVDTVYAHVIAWQRAFEEARLPTVRRMILVALDATAAKARRDAGEALTAEDEEAVATFDGALAELEQTQTDDFAGLFRAMDGLPASASMRRIWGATRPSAKARRSTTRPFTRCE